MPLTLRQLGLGFFAYIAPGLADSGTVFATPHDTYSSSIGVLGCYIDTDRVAYWPASVSCNNICVSLTYNKTRTVNLLRIDQSQGAYDISYDAWNYLLTGDSAAKSPISGGPVEMEYEDVDASECADLIHTEDSRLPLSASNSVNFLASCLEQEDSYVAQNYVLYNLLDATCQWGYDETCELVDFPAQNQPQCSHSLGTPIPCTSLPVYNLMYPTGEKVRVGDPVPVVNANATFNSYTVPTGGSSINTESSYTSSHSSSNSGSSGSSSNSGSSSSSSIPDGPQSAGWGPRPAWGILAASFAATAAVAVLQ
ncbi:hypothetical protein CFIMG_007698RA00001 [Ceratocystis fimbriata CBS 114723]|uniref:Uncharacterized protein n=1 Tax=Ceratocystis fimbriata CBS 114723 TaxID=1035309 RepID=A0A2C5XC21_9PEZI|nr:hypothetical protein CFIMG_007698RA00001 [Ceratocystis fimbriata CBS 114723]